MAGHYQNSPAFIVQDERDFCFDIDKDVVNAMFPCRHIHLAELRSKDGCQCECSSHFLCEVLVYVTKVVLQDGSFWIVNYPDHWISNRIKCCLHMLGDNEKMNEYRKWCDSMDIERKKVLRSKHASLIERMPGFLSDSTQMIMCRLDSIHSLIENNNAKVVERLKKIEDKVSSSFVSPSKSSCMDEFHSPRKSNSNKVHLIPSYSSPHKKGLVLADCRMKYIPQLVGRFLDPHLMFEYWMSHKLYHFKDVKKTDWGDTLQQRYSRHKQYIEIMEKHASIHFGELFKVHDPESDSYKRYMLEMSLLMKQEMQRFKGKQMIAWKYFLFLKGMEKRKEIIKNHVNEITLVSV